MEGAARGLCGAYQFLKQIGAGLAFDLAARSLPDLINYGSNAEKNNLVDCNEE